jgi:acyl-coenzyme A synthetase/AMP-(fatty) acid ligase
MLLCQSPATVPHQAASKYSFLFTPLNNYNFRCAAAAAAAGEALAIAMPLTVEAAVIYFGIVLAGCVVVSIADSFAASEVAVRLRIAGAVAVFTQVGMHGMQFCKSLKLPAAQHSQGVQLHSCCSAVAIDAQHSGLPAT